MEILRVKKSEIISNLKSYLQLGYEPKVMKIEGKSFKEFFNNFDIEFDINLLKKVFFDEKYYQESIKIEGYQDTKETRENYKKEIENGIFRELKNKISNTEIIYI